MLCSLVRLGLAFLLVGLLVFAALSGFLYTSAAGASPESWTIHSKTTQDASLSDREESHISFDFFHEFNLPDNDIQKSFVFSSIPTVSEGDTGHSYAHHKRSLQAIFHDDDDENNQEGQDEKRRKGDEEDGGVIEPMSFTIKSARTTVWRPSHFPAYPLPTNWNYSSPKMSSDDAGWVPYTISSPVVTDKHTLIQLARMTANTYKQLGAKGKGWYDLDLVWDLNGTLPFGWGPTEDGFRGYIFRSSDNSTLVLAIKGTTLSGPSSKKDKLNDNLLFSCCCAWVDWSWRWASERVCGCRVPGKRGEKGGGGEWRCDEGCLGKALREESLFYGAGVNLINNITTLYPNTTLWLVGHSLGGALASLLGTTFGMPAIAFSSPGERLAFTRLFPRSSHPLPPASSTTHIYLTSDPIALGTCTGPFSPCARAGYAMQSRCHLGQSVVFDTVNREGWRVDVRRHRIAEMVRVLEMEGEWPEWNVEEGDEGEWREVPRAKEEVDCVDCYQWEFGDYHDELIDFHDQCNSDGVELGPSS